ncbi:MAG: CYTH domain-containing protein [Crocinitomicaceae bacterium]|nr:CYTH domain-containing protein [Crocinitomicaceae bacterium]
MKEIEYKFLVDQEAWSKLDKPKPTLIVQGYISKSVESTVRVRIKGEKGYLTIKGKTEGISRSEFEYEIPLNEAEEMIDLFIHKYINKHRYEVIVDGKTWEVDEFHGKLEGLILAELEVESEEESFQKPDWVTKDVSTDPQYFNAVLIDKC